MCSLVRQDEFLFVPAGDLSVPLLFLFSFFLLGEKEMKLKLFFIVLLALLASGCAQEIVAVPKAVLTGTGNVITAVVDTLIFWD